MILKVLGWFLGVSFLMSSIASLSTGKIVIGLILLLASAICLPPLLNKINAAAKGKVELTQGRAVIASVVLIVIAGFIGSGSDPKTENIAVDKVQEKKQTIDSSERGELKPIDLIYQLKTIVDELDYWFKGPFKESDKLRFYDVKNNYDKQLDVICSDFDRLVENTGNLNSEYYDEALACSNFELSLVHVIQNLNHGTYAEIPKLRQKLEPAYQNLKQQVDEEIKRLNNK